MSSRLPNIAMRPGLSAKTSFHNLKFAAIRALWRIVCMSEEYKARRALRNLSEHQLRDVGLTREQVDIEAERPVPWH